MKKLFLIFLFAAGSTFGILAKDITVYIKNNAVGTNISDIIILGRNNSREWTTLYGGQKISRSDRDSNFGYQEIRKFKFKDLGMSEYQIRYTAKQGELNLVEQYWTGNIVNGSVFVMECKVGKCVLIEAPILVPVGASATTE